VQAVKEGLKPMVQESRRIKRELQVIKANQARTTPMVDDYQAEKRKRLAPQQYETQISNRASFLIMVAQQQIRR